MTSEEGCKYVQSHYPSISYVTVHILLACVAGAKRGREGEKNVRGEELEGAPALKAQCFPSPPSGNSIRLTVNTGTRHANSRRESLRLLKSWFIHNIV